MKEAETASPSVTGPGQDPARFRAGAVTVKVHWNVTGVEPAVSVNVTVNVNVPGVVGVPLSVAVLPLLVRVRPDEPLTANRYVPFPPPAVSGIETGEFAGTAAGHVAESVSAGNGGAAIAIVQEPVVSALVPLMT